MNKEIKIEKNINIECFDKVRLIRSSLPRDLDLNYEFQFHTEENPTWDNDDDSNHYFEVVDIFISGEKIARLYHKDIDKLFEFVEFIRRVRKDNDKVIKDCSFYKNRQNKNSESKIPPTEA